MPLDLLTQEDARWRDTLAAINSINAGKSITEVDVNAWLSSWGTDSQIQQFKKLNEYSD